MTTAVQKAMRGKVFRHASFANERKRLREYKRAIEKKVEQIRQTTRANELAALDAKERLRNFVSALEARCRAVSHEGTPVPVAF